jgi:hypothetical protein
MNSTEESAHKKLTGILADSRVSTSVLAYKMLKENKYVNEAFIELFVNYVYMMSDTKLIPIHLAEIQQACKWLKQDMEELGLPDIVGKLPMEQTDYLAI